MEFVHIDKVQLDKLYHAFITAFSDYSIPLKLSPEDFRIRFFNKLKVKAPLSVAARLDDHQVGGFILHSLQEYEGIPTIYNGGTGVLPDLRRQKVAYRMYEWIMPYLLNSDAQRIILEVISDNTPAVKLYQDLGFTYKQTFKCFSSKEWDFTSQSPDLHLKKVENWDPGRYLGLRNYPPSFIDNDRQLKSNWINEILIEAHMGSEVVGYVVFQPRISRISQIGFGKSGEVAMALIKQVGLLGEREKVTILNISESCVQITEILESIGFVNEIDQFEMEMIL